MKRSKNDTCDDWVYQLDGQDIDWETESPPEDLSLTIVVCTAEEEIHYRILVARD